MAALMATLIVLSSCGTAFNSADATTGAVNGRAAYFLSPGDKLNIKVFDEADLTGEYQVDETGTIAFPLTGNIKASGLTLEEFRLGLIRRLKDGYVRNPRITIDILNYRPINIIGEVNKAGQYDYRPGISSRDVVAIAGGYTYRANQSKIHVIRDSIQEPIVVSVNEKDFDILPGDTVRIPERLF